MFDVTDKLVLVLVLLLLQERLLFAFPSMYPRVISTFRLTPPCRTGRLENIIVC